MIRVIIADDHHLVRKGIRALLEKTDDIEVVGEAGDGQEAIDLTEHLVPDVLVMDISMPRLNGILAAERVRSQGVSQVVILSMYSDETLVHQALKAGARGYLLKRSVTEELLLAIRAASRGEIFLSPSVSHSVIPGTLTGDTPSGDTARFDRLSRREREVLQLVAEGYTNNEIAEILFISVKTVEKHRSSVMSKLGVHDLAGLVRVALKHGLIFLDE